MMPFSLPAASVLPSGEKAIVVTPLVWDSGPPIASQLVVDQMRMVWSRLADANSPPLGENATAVTLLECALVVLNTCVQDEFQARRVLSSQPDASSPPEENATEFTPAGYAEVNAGRATTIAPLLTCRTILLPPELPATSWRPSAENASVVILPTRFVIVRARVAFVVQSPAVCHR